jgi:hypothetical protein
MEAGPVRTGASMTPPSTRSARGRARSVHERTRARSTRQDRQQGPSSQHGEKLRGQKPICDEPASRHDLRKLICSWRGRKPVDTLRERTTSALTTRLPHGQQPRLASGNPRTDCGLQTNAGSVLTTRLKTNGRGGGMTLLSGLREKARRAPVTRTRAVKASGRRQRGGRRGRTSAAAKMVNSSTSRNATAA